MEYPEIVNLLITILNLMMLIFPLWYALVCVVGFFAKNRKFPTRKEKLRYGVVVCARNEEKVIGDLIDSIRKSDYPQDKIDIFVIAHNCSDDTAKVARERHTGGGIYVYEYNNPNERTKGYALKRIFEFIDRDFGILNYDGFHVFDADNILDEQYFNKMNDAFLFYDKKNAITSFRNSKNFGMNVQTATYGISFVTNCSIESSARMAMNCSSRLLGSGFLVSSKMVENGWNMVDLSDDTDFTAEMILSGSKVMYCGEAMYYDEHPTTFKTMWRQRLRWAKGALVVLRKRFKDFTKTIFSFKKTDKKKLRGSSFDLLSVTVPFSAVGFFLFLVNVILISLTPLFSNFSMASLWTWWAISTGMGIAFFYLSMCVCAIVCYIKEGRRIKNVSVATKIKSILVWPLFVLMLIPLQIVAMFKKNLVWKPIAHTDSGGVVRRT